MSFESANVQLIWIPRRDLWQGALFLSLHMPRLRRRDRGFPDTMVQGAPDFGEFAVLEDDERDHQDADADHAREQSLHEDAPDLGHREDACEDAQRQI